jgi:nitrogen fixation protein NifU and related proteins
MNMYQENIMDHFKNPRNKGVLENPSITKEEHNPVCGDVVKVMLKIKDNTLTNIMFDGSGCAISQAAMSMITEQVKNKSVEEVLTINKDTILDLLGIPIGPVRIKCALLGLRTIQKAIVEGVQCH